MLLYYIEIHFKANQSHRIKNVTILEILLS